MKLGAKELRTKSPTLEEFGKIKKNPVYIILDNVLDTYNIGAIFRLADAVAAKKVILCGESEVPPHTRIKKASINTTEWVTWEYAETAVLAIKNLKLEIGNLTVVAIEQSPKSVAYDEFDYQFPLVLVVGHESDGVSNEVLKIADAIVEIPMWGVNKSLNVMVSLGIVLFKAMEKSR
ncbi:MAG: tRNA/rRNA methyltransferase [Candidatus Levybacteria bacterium GW2011_GWC1_40_19]|nr:MAG: tRNA/rRNA methyltransferase [Candidatus Levybacteria bacterium GW2011_GWC1_40_19]KKR93201.1 MAG: tRNA/rRNA methyltransferase [Candidatus Levybacteria bacterium GW2011_GWA2_41_15]HBB76641.1 RNA methyltransferase [Candidatus Levybacteria bacterium]